MASAVWMLVRKDAGCFLVRSQGCGVCVCARERQREREGEKERGRGREKGREREVGKDRRREGGRERETERPRGAEDRAGRGTENRTRALGKPLRIFSRSLINANMGSVTGAVLKILLLLSTQNWNRVIAGNSCKYTANDLNL